jgi:hypothetical protein
LNLEWLLLNIRNFNNIIIQIIGLIFTGITSIAGIKYLFSNWKIRKLAKMFEKKEIDKEYLQEIATKGEYRRTALKKFYRNMFRQLYLQIYIFFFIAWTSENYSIIGCSNRTSFEYNLGCIRKSMRRMITITIPIITAVYPMS